MKYLVTIVVQVPGTTDIRMTATLVESDRLAGDLKSHIVFDLQRVGYRGVSVSVVEL